MLIYDVRNLYTSIRIKYGKTYRLDCDALVNSFDSLTKIACVCHNRIDNLNFKHVLSAHNFIVKEKVFSSKSMEFLDIYCTMMTAAEIMKSEAEEIHIISQSPFLIPAIQAAKNKGVIVNIHGIFITKSFLNIVDSYTELDDAYFKKILPNAVGV